MAMRQSIAIAAIALTVGWMASCGGARPSHYYHLELPAPLAAASPASDAYPVELLIGRLTAAHIYREDRIVYTTGSERMGTYEYHRWAEPPTEMLEALLLRRLRASGRFRSVQPLRSNARGDFILRGRLHRFEEVSSGQLAARVAFEIELDDLKTGAAVWSTFYSQDEPVSGKDVPAVVAALDRNVQRGLEQVLAGLDQYFATHPPK